MAASWGCCVKEENDEQINQNNNAFFLAGDAFRSRLLMLFCCRRGPVSPTADPGTDVLFGLRNVGATAQQYAAQMQAYANEATQKVKAAKKKYMEQFTGFMGGLFKKKEKAAIPGSKTIQESKIADIYDPESVKKALYTLFMAYPIDCDKNAENFAACAAYKQKAEEFYQDTVIEIYTSVRLMEQTMAELTAEVENLSSTFYRSRRGRSRKRR